MRQVYTPNREDIVKLIAAMNTAQLELWYDIGESILNAPIAEDENGKAEPTAEELAAEDALWDAAFTRHADRFSDLAAQAARDIETGRVLPMFDERGKWLVDDYTETDFDKAALKAS